MLLTEIRQRIEAELQYGPDIQSHRDELSQLVNDEYQNLLSDHPWTFLQEVATLNVFGSDGEFSGSISGGLITFDTSGIVRDAWLGATLEYTDDNGDSFTSEILAVDAGNDRILVNNESSGTIADPMTVTFPKYILPEDLTDILGLMSRDDDRGPLEYIPLEAEQEYMMNTDVTGDPSEYMLVPQIQEAAPRTAPTLTTGPGTLAAGTYYYCYTWVHAGRESARSPVASATLSSAGQIELSAMETDGSNSAFSTRRIYRKDGTTGVWRKLADDDGSSSGPYADNAPTTFDNDVRVYQDRGPRQYVRFWPLPASTVATAKTTSAAPEQYELRYRFMPRRMQHDTDAPEIPSEHHILLVHLVVERLAARKGDKNLERLHEKLGNAQLKKMRARYLTRSAATFQRRIGTVSRRYAGAPLVITKS